MDHDRLAGRQGNLHLPDEDFPLPFARRVVVMEVQADLADRKHLRVIDQPSKILESLFVGLRCVMGMNADRCIDRLVFVGQADRGFEVRRSVSRTDGEHRDNTRFPSPLQNLVPIRRKSPIIEVAMGIDDQVGTPCPGFKLLIPRCLRFHGRA